MKRAWQEQAENHKDSKKWERRGERGGDTITSGSGQGMRPVQCANIHFARCHSDKLAHFWQKWGYYTILISRESLFR